jgi:cytosine/adenosine deaminase-related metal-dependent hydrolase
MMYVTGQIYQDGVFKEGYLGVEEGYITEFGEGIKENALKKGIIIPTLVNAHTHIGDAVYQKEVKGGIKEIVAPPDGLKHRVLRETTEEAMRNSMKHVAKKMLLSGIAHFCDFREGGLEGVNILKSALSDSPLTPKAFGRPKGLKYVKEEVEEILKVSDGIGLSAVSDWPEDDMKKVASHTKSQKKSFALHASERTREDIDFILDLKPDFLIHMNKATESDLNLCAESDVPIILCPRSEVFFGHVPDIPKMLKSNVTLALGTDNAMLNSPDSLLREMEFTYKISRLSGDCLAKDILDMVLINSRKVLNVGDDICLTQGKQAGFIVFELSKVDPVYALVNGACAGDISMICVNDYLWVKK